MDPQWFAAEGWPSAAMGGLFLLAAAGTLAWLRGPGSRPHDPPIARNGVLSFAGMLALFGLMWIVRAVSGIGGSAIVAAVLLLVSLGMVARARLRRS